MKNNLVIKSNSLINFKGKYKYSKNELKIICSLISNVKKEDKDFTIKEIELSSLGFTDKEFNNHTYLNDLCDDLLSKPFTIPNTKKKVNWFSLLEPENGILSYRFDPSLKEHLLDLKGHFTSYYLSNVLRLNSSYSIHIYELLKQLEGVGFRKFDLQEFRELLSIPKTYKLSNIRNLIEKSQLNIIEKTDLRFTYDFIKVGRSFKYINFKILKNKNNSNDFKTFIKSVRKNYVNQLILIGNFNKEEKSLSVNGDGKLYYLDDRKAIDSKTSTKIWDFLFENQEKMKRYTKSLI